MIYGGAAGGGKTFGILLDPLRDIHNPGFGGVIFRREQEMIRNEGGLWDESTTLYPLIGAKPNVQQLFWKFPSGARVGFDGLQTEGDVLKHQGSQIAFMGFDELTHFTAKQFWYMVSRNRSTCGVRPRIRATTNPDPESWVFHFIRDWVDPKSENPAKSGEIRWFIRKDGQIIWVDKGTEGALSVTFIKATIFDNKILLQSDPDYLNKLQALDPIERRRLLDGDWTAVAGGDIIDPAWFKRIDYQPILGRKVRYFDIAISAKETADRSAGALMGIGPDRSLYLLDMALWRATWADGKERMVQIILEDAKRCKAEGCEYAVGFDARMTQMALFEDLAADPRLRGIALYPDRSKGDKLERASGWLPRARLGQFFIGPGWDQQSFFSECVAFTGSGKDVHDDQIDAVSGGSWLLSAHGYKPYEFQNENPFALRIE